MQVLESYIEKTFVQKLKAHGIKNIKLNLQGRRSYPDRLIILPAGVVIFIELKRPGEEPCKLQEFTHGELRALNHDVQVFDDADKAFAYVLRKKDT